MKCFKKITNMALAKGWMKKDAFYAYKMEQDETAPVFLTYDELQTVMNKEFTIPRLALVRDIFIFACFTGLAFVDVSTLKKEDMVQDNNGDWWIRKGRIKLMHRRKASSICNIPLLPVPLAILKKYENNPVCIKKGYCLPVPCNQKMNSYLKEIADFCGIKKNITTHVQAIEILYYIRAMIETFCQHGNYENRAKARTRFMQETLGVDGLKMAFLENVQKMKEKGGLDLHVEEKTVTKKGSGEISDKRVIAQKQPGLYAVAYHPIGGCLPTGKPAELLALLKEIPDAECRIAPHETIYIINLTADEAKKVLAATADGAQTAFENSVTCIGASICQQGVRDSQAALRAAVAAVREAGIPDGALPKICISGCPSSCSAHQAAALGFQGAAKTVDGKPESAFKMFVGGSDKLGAAKFGEAGAVILERDLPKLLVELGKAAAASNMNWETWIDGHGDEFRAIVEKYA